MPRGEAEGCADGQKLAAGLGVGAGPGGGKTAKSRNYFLQLSFFINSQEAAALIEGRDEAKGGGCCVKRAVVLQCHRKPALDFGPVCFKGGCKMAHCIFPGGGSSGGGAAEPLLAEPIEPPPAPAKL